MFSCSLSMRLRLFLDLSNVFGNVWHQGLLFKIGAFAIRGKLLNVLEDYLLSKFQRVLYNV